MLHRIVPRQWLMSVHIEPPLLNDQPLHNVPVFCYYHIGFSSAKELPERVYVSFDIDGLSPENCPHTGTPVAGGLSYNEAIYLLHAVTASGRTIIGFDLCEVVPEHAKQWDANVGARVLYKLCGQTLKSNK